MKQALAAVVLCLGCFGALGCEESGGGAYPGGYWSGAPSPDDTGGTTDAGGDSGAYIESAQFGTFLGSFPASWAHLYGQLENSEGGPLSLVSEIRVSNPSGDIETAFVEVAMPGFAQPVTRRVDVPAGQTVSVEPLTPTFDYAALYGVVTPVSAEIEVTVTVDGELVDHRSESVSVEPVGRVHWAYEEGGETHDMRPFVVTLVTPDDSGGTIQQLIRDAAPYTSSGAMVGYQPGTIEQTYEQAAAIFLALQNVYAMVYTNVPGSFFDGAQRVRLPAESLATESANCIDGALVFASAFEALGMEPVLLFVEGHALIAVKGVPGGDSSQWIPIETTMVGFSSFDDAVQAGIDRVNSAIDVGDPHYLAVDVVAMRRGGFAPVNR